MVPENVRHRYYFVIVMPIDADGQGPATIDYGVTLTWEIWTQDIETVASFNNLPDAIQQCERLNKNYYGVTD